MIVCLILLIIIYKVPFLLTFQLNYYAFASMKPIFIFHICNLPFCYIVAFMTFCVVDIFLYFSSSLIEIPSFGLYFPVFIFILSTIIWCCSSCCKSHLIQLLCRHSCRVTVILFKLYFSSFAVLLLLLFSFFVSSLTAI